MSHRLIDRLMGAVRNAKSDYHRAGGCAKTKADERLVYESLKADLEQEDLNDVFDDDRIN